jgi:ApaG protein
MQSSQHQIDIQVDAQFIQHESDPKAKKYVFAYTIRIENTGEHAATLKSRHWIITDANGKKVEVRGDGVIGQQPRIEPGNSYEYTSGAVITTPIGCMQGSYQMQDDHGQDFEAAIPTFSLANPNQLH